MSDQPKLEDFLVRSFDKLRYGDTDRQGHVNNAVFATFLETGRCDLLERVWGAFWSGTGASFVLVRLELDYRAELFWPGRVEIGTAVKSLGNSSIRMVQAVFQDGRLAATAETVGVHLNAQKRPAPLQEDVRAKLSLLMLPCA